MESKEHKFTEAETEEELTTTKLPDLANSAVVAIHNLATVPPTTQPTPEVDKSTRKFRHSSLRFPVINLGKEVKVNLSLCLIN
jgi:hypothetical protein